MIKNPGFKAPPLVSVIVVTLNTPDLTSVCLESVLRNSSVPYELILVNNSRARAIRRCLKRFPALRVLQNSRNVGYAKAANQGALEARGQYLCFLNSDTIVPPQWLEQLLRAAQKPRVGISGPATDVGSPSAGPCLHPLLSDFNVVRQINQAWRRKRWLSVTEVPTLGGFCWMIPRVVLARTGLFDERFYFGGDDADFCLRTRLLGYRLLRVDSLFVYHRGSGSASPERRRRLLAPNGALFRKKWGRLFPEIRWDHPSAAETAIDRKLRKRFQPSPEQKHPLEKRTRTRRGRPHRVRVSIMMAAHNAERWIGGAIESVLNQSLREFELIIVDDGSLDRTAEIARRYRRDPRVRIFQNQTQAGIPMTRNRIVGLARGPLIGVCDADDLMQPTLLERLVEFLEEHPRVGWVYADRVRIDADGQPLGTVPAIPPNGFLEFQMNIIGHAGAVIRRKAIREAGGYDETLLSTEDYDLALKIARRWKIHALPGETHYLWRLHSENISQQNPWALKETQRILFNHRPAVLL